MCQSPANYFSKGYSSINLFSFDNEKDFWDSHNWYFLMQFFKYWLSISELTKKTEVYFF